MRRLGFLLQKEFIQIFRDKTILLILFLITVIMLFILPPAAKVKTSRMMLSVVDHDRTNASAQFIRKLTSSNQFGLGTYVNTYREGLEALERGETTGILEIPEGFEQNIREMTEAPIMLEIDAVNGVTAGLSSFYFLQMLEQYIWETVDGFGLQPGFQLESQEEILARMEAEAQAEMKKKKEAVKLRQKIMLRPRQEPEIPKELQAANAGKALQPKGAFPSLPEVSHTMVVEDLSVVPSAPHLSVPDVQVPPLGKDTGSNFLQINMKVQDRFNPDGDSSLYRIPSILAILVCVIGTVLSALNIVSEKESGTIEQMNVTPIRRSVFIFSKIIPAWVIGIAILTIGLIIVRFVYGISPQSSYWGIYFVSFLFLVSMVGFGVLISTACRNQQQAMLLCFFFLLIICLLCGMWTPIASMPGWARIIADINPLRYYIDTMRFFFAYDSEVRHMWPQIRTLVVFIVIFNGWAIWNFRKAA